MDLPYDQRHVAEYGETFAPMEKAKFEDIIAALIGALPFSQFALVVHNSYLIISTVGLPFC